MREQPAAVGVPAYHMKHHIPCSVWSLRRSLVVILLGASLAVLPGCIAVAAGAGAGAVAYVRGDLEANLEHDYNQVLKAARKAVEDLEFAKVSENKDALKAVLISRTAMDKKVEIIVTNSGKTLTNIKIRVGLIGDQELSMKILDKIKARL